MKKLFCLIGLLLSFSCSSVYADTSDIKEISDSYNSSSRSVVEFFDYTFEVPEVFEQTSVKDNGLQFNIPDESACIIVARGVNDDLENWESVLLSGLTSAASNIAENLTILSYDSTSIAGNDGSCLYSIGINDSNPISIISYGFVDRNANAFYSFSLIDYFGESKKNYVIDFKNIVNSTSKKVSTSSSSDVEYDVSEEFKQTMDDYKEFFQEYADFMKKYQSADSSEALSLLVEYSSFLDKYSKAMDALNNMDQDKLSEAEQKYYLNTMLDIEKILIDVAVQ